MNSKTNDTHPLAFATGDQGENLNILIHDQATKVVDSDKFRLSMAEKNQKMWENEIYSIIKKKEVRPGHSILRSV